MKLVFIQILSKHRILRQIIISQQGRIKHLFDMTEHEICKKYGYIQKGTSIILMVT